MKFIFQLYEITEANKLLEPVIEYIDGMSQVAKLIDEATTLEKNVAVSMKVTANTAAGVKSATANTAAGFRSATTSAGTMASQAAISQREQNRKSECICSVVSIRVIFCNMQSVNPLSRWGSMENKFDRLKSLIERNDPDIVALVETWLNNKHDNEFVRQRLDLQNYDIFRQDRCDGHHEGIIIPE